MMLLSRILPPGADSHQDRGSVRALPIDGEAGARGFPLAALRNGFAAERILRSMKHTFPPILIS